MRCIELVNLNHIIFHCRRVGVHLKRIENPPITICLNRYLSYTFNRLNYFLISRSLRPVLIQFSIGFHVLGKRQCSRKSHHNSQDSHSSDRITHDETLENFGVEICKLKVDISNLSTLKFHVIMFQVSFLMWTIHQLSDFLLVTLEIMLKFYFSIVETNIFLRVYFRAVTFSFTNIPLMFK